MDSKKALSQIENWMNSKLKSNDSQEILHYEGRTFIPGLSVKCLDYLKNEWKVPENSVIIASFPKSGTNWCFEIVRQILYGKDEEMLAVTRLLFPIEFGSVKLFQLYDHVPLPRKCFITHVDDGIFNLEKAKKSNSKVMYVYRNPKDQAASFFRFTRNLPLFEKLNEAIFGKDWEDFLSKYTSGEIPNGLHEKEWYPDYVAAWMKHKDDSDFLPIEYESLKKSLPMEIRRISKFLEVELSDEDVKRIIERCSITSMRKDAETEKSGLLKYNVDKGEIGGWKDRFSVSQSEFMDRIIEEKLSHLGIQFTYNM